MVNLDNYIFNLEQMKKQPIFHIELQSQLNMLNNNQSISQIIKNF